MLKLIKVIETLVLILPLARLTNNPPMLANRAKAIDIRVNIRGFEDLLRAAAAGVIARLKTSSVPTIWAASVTANAKTSKKSNPISLRGTPLASATSGSTEANNNGRYIISMAIVAPIPIATRARS